MSRPDLTRHGPAMRVHTPHFIPMPHSAIRIPMWPELVLFPAKQLRDGRPVAWMRQAASEPPSDSLRGDFEVGCKVELLQASSHHGASKRLVHADLLARAREVEHSKD